MTIIYLQWCLFNIEHFVAARRFQISLEKFPVSAWPCCILITNLQLARAELGTTGLSFLYGFRAFILQYGSRAQKGNKEFENHHDGNENVAKLNVIAATCFVGRNLETIIL